MTRTMGDATGPSSASLPAGLDLYAGYVTGTAAVIWTQMDWALVPAAKRVTIDQGFTGAPRYDANVIDVESGAWPPSAVAGWMAHATAPRPTVYCNRSTLPAVLAGGFRGDLWLAIPGWKQGDPLPAAPGCTIVAVQNNYDNPAYDLSTVLDGSWPQTGDPQMALSYDEGWRPCTKCSGLFNIVNGKFGWGNVCPAGGSHQSGTQGTVSTYALTVDGTAQAGN